MWSTIFAVSDHSNAVIYERSISMSIYSDFKPTVLIIKQHNRTGLKYLHKTTRLHIIESYSGSGKHWKNHLKKYGNDWTNVWISEQFDNPVLLEEFALFLSEFLDVVNSKEWANLILENGLDGSGAQKGKRHSEETCQKIRDTKRKTKKSISDEIRRKISESNKKKHQTEETKQKMREAGRNISDETRRKRSESNKNISDETRQKLRDAHKGKTHSDETKRKISEAAKNRKKK